MMQRHLRRVVGDDPSRTQSGGIGVHPLEVVEPELRIELPGIVFDQRQLHPPHRLVEPTHAAAGRRRALRGGRAMRLNGLPTLPNAAAPVVTWRKSRRERLQSLISDHSSLITHH